MEHQCLLGSNAVPEGHLADGSLRGVVFCYCCYNKIPETSTVVKKRGALSPLSQSSGIDLALIRASWGTGRDRIGKQEARGTLGFHNPACEYILWSEHLPAGMTTYNFQHTNLWRHNPAWQSAGVTYMFVNCYLWRIRLHEGWEEVCVCMCVHTNMCVHMSMYVHVCASMCACA